MVHDEMLTVSLVLMVAVARTMSVPDEPTVQSKIFVPAPLLMRAHAAVPVAIAVPLVIALAVAVPPDEAAKDVSRGRSR